MRRPQPYLQPHPSEITPPGRYFNRREVITALAAVGAVGAGLPRDASAAQRMQLLRAGGKLRELSVDEVLTELAKCMRPYGGVE